MKKLILFALTIGMVTLAKPVKAQTSSNAPSFFNTALSYFTSFNTNLDSTFGDSKGTIWTGVDSIQGGRTPLANALGLSYTLYGPIAADSVTRNAGVAGTLVSQQIGASLNFVVHDAKITLYADAGYELDAPSGAKLQDKVFGEIGVRVNKALTAHTFAGIGIGAQLPRNSQVFSTWLGITF